MTDDPKPAETGDPVAPPVDKVPESKPVETFTRAEAEELFKQSQAEAEKSRIDPERIKAQVKTFKERPELYAEVKRQMGESNSDDRVLELELKLVRKELITEFGLETKDEIALNGDEDQMRKIAAHLAERSKQSGKPKAGGSEQEEVETEESKGHLPRPMPTGKRKPMSLKQARENFHS